LKIGVLASRTRLNASAINLLQQCGLLATPYRIGGQRRYSSHTVYRVLLIRFASDMGFTLDEIKLFLSGLRDNRPVWPSLEETGSATTLRGRGDHPALAPVEGTARTPAAMSWRFAPGVRRAPQPKP
jgi:DNA-binding transcriptional MerR regulator